MEVTPAGVLASPVLRQTRDATDHVESVQPLSAHDALGRLTHLLRDVSDPGVEVVIVTVAKLSLRFLLVQVCKRSTSFEEYSFFYGVSRRDDDRLADHVVHNSVVV